MKTYKQVISELSLTSLVRYREAAKKHVGKMGAYLDREFENPDYYDRRTPSYKKLFRKFINRSHGVDLATKKINRKMRVGKLAKPLEK